jgi:Transposase domain (DUF772)
MLLLCGCTARVAGSSRAIFSVRATTTKRLTGALLLQALYTVRSERQLMEQLDYNLLFRWFVGLSADDPVWEATVFCNIAAKFFASVLNLPQVRSLFSNEHFTSPSTARWSKPAPA